ncbi:hypothetical protein M0805_000904 [Coniferiporia weirii]|nr:hypothetical protein M0805_000904 [Coniferiporia weirii]
MAEYTVKLATASDFGEFYDDEKTVQWPRAYRSYANHAAFNTELSQIAAAAELATAGGKVTVHSATFQTFLKGQSEDRHDIQFWEFPSGVWTFSAVFDGHLGYELSEYARQAMSGFIHQALSAALSGDSVTVAPQAISAALKEGIEAFDKSLYDNLMSRLPTNFAEMSEEELKGIINDQESGGKVHQAIIRGIQGSTVIIALVDPARENVWVANLGDCQAVLAETDTTAPNGFKATLLSSAHNGRVKGEAERVRSEHPGEPDVVLRNRVLGSIAVTRAIGDFTFKLPAVYIEKVFLKTFDGYKEPKKAIDTMKRSRTPPYVSSIPEVEHRALKGEEGSGTHKFSLILCSDGLTDLYEERIPVLEDMVRQIAKVSLKEVQGEYEGFGKNLALRVAKDALGEDLEKQSLKLTVDLHFKYMDDTTVVVPSW